MLWWSDTTLIFIALIRIKTYALSVGQGQAQLNYSQLLMHLAVGLMFGVCSFPILTLQLIWNNYYGYAFFSCQIVETIVAGVAALIILWIFKNIVY